MYPSEKYHTHKMANLTTNKYQIRVVHFYSVWGKYFI